MDQWVIFGYGHYLSDVFDIIHANGGRVKSIINNITPTEEQEKDLKRRILLLGYNVPVTELVNFRPGSEEKYCYGFLNGREKLVESIKASYKIEFEPLIHPTAYLGSNVRYGEGVIIGPGTVIAPNCMINGFGLLNRAVSIGHDSEIGEYSTISPGVSIAGMVKIGRRSTVGIGATVIDGITIGSNSIVGAGAVVVKDVPDNVVVVGVPAKVIRNNE